MGLVDALKERALQREVEARLTAWMHFQFRYPPTIDLTEADVIYLPADASSSDAVAGDVSPTPDRA